MPLLLPPTRDFDLGRRARPDREHGDRLAGAAVRRRRLGGADPARARADAVPAAAGRRPRVRRAPAWSPPTLFDIVRRRAHPERVLTAPPTRGTPSAPALVFAAAGAPAPDIADWAVLALALRRPVRERPADRDRPRVARPRHRPGRPAARDRHRLPDRRVPDPRRAAGRDRRRRPPVRLPARAPAAGAAGRARRRPRAAHPGRRRPPRRADRGARAARPRDPPHRRGVRRPSSTAPALADIMVAPPSRRSAPTTAARSLAAGDGRARRQAPARRSRPPSSARARPARCGS